MMEVSVKDENKNKKIKDVLKKSYGLVQTLAVFLAMFIIMSIALPRFLNVTNLTNIIRQLSVNLIVAAGMTFIILNGEFDISVGSVLALVATVAAKLMPIIGILPSCLIAFLIGPAFGVVHGIIVTKGKIPSFITTLGTMMIARSLAFVVTRGRVLSNLPESFKFIGQGTIIGIPFTLFLVILVYFFCFVVLKMTPFGTKIYAVGANRKVAVLSGINADRIKIQSFVVVGILTSFAAIILLSRLAAIQADTGRGLEFDVIAAVVIGGTSLYGGEGNVLQTIIGVVIIGLIRNFLNLSRIDIFWQDFATGSIIIIAVLLDSLRKRISSK